MQIELIIDYCGIYYIRIVYYMHDFELSSKVYINVLNITAYFFTHIN